MGTNVNFYQELVDLLTCILRILVFIIASFWKKWGLYWICLVLPEFCGSVIVALLWKSGGYTGFALSFRNSVVLSSSFCHSVITFQMELEYLWGQLANVDQIIYEASIGRGKGCISFGTDWIKTLVSMATENAHWLIMGKMMSPPFLCCFFIRFFIRFFSNLQLTRTGIKSRTNSNFGQVGPLPTELGALERLKNFPYTYNGKMVSPS